MNFARALIRELVDKRLWPIAIVLVVALVAVPVLLSAGGDSAASGDAPLPADTGATKVAAVELAGPPSVRSRPGNVRNPFRGAGGKTAGAATSATSARAATAATAAGGVTAADEPAQSPGPTTPDAPETVPTTPAAAPAYHRTVVRWYEATAGAPRPLARLTPLGDRADPAALYLGVTSSDARYAIFLLGPNATAEGEANCEDTSNCRLVGLKTGATQIITVQPADGGEARRYHLEVVSAKAVTTTAAQARTMRAKVHDDGRDVMRELWQDALTAKALRPIRYEQATGLLYESSTTTGTEKIAK